MSPPVGPGASAPLSGGPGAHPGEAWAHELSRAFLEGAPDAVVVIDTSGRVVMVNAETERLFGRLRDDLIGASVEILLPSRLWRAPIDHHEALPAESPTRPVAAGSDAYGQRADGTEFPIHVSLSPLETAGEVYVAVAVRDLTEQKRLEATREDFIRYAAHELRTPLATLSALVETLAMRLDEMSPDNVALALGALRRQGERASILVSNLLDLAQLEGGHSGVRLGRVELGPLIDRVMESAPAPDGRTVTSRLADGLTVVADPVQLERVVTNLLTNAYRYGGPAVRIDAERAGDDVVIAVADDGNGLPADLIETIFEPFVRGRDAGAAGGSGIGLTLCRRIMASLGGSIWYEQSTGAATFKLQLRASCSDAAVKARL